MEEPSAPSVQPTEDAESHTTRLKQSPPPPPPLDLAPPLCTNLEILGKMHGAGQRTCQKELQFLLVGAIEEQRLDRIKDLVADGVNVDCTILYSKTPLTHAIELTFVEVAKLLVTSGASVNKPELLAYARRPLHLALDIHNHQLVEFLLQHGAEVDGQDGCGATPLHKACFLGDTDAVEILLSAGASVTAGDSVGRTAFHRAVEGQHYELANYLLAYGADINSRDKFGWTPLNQTIIFSDIYAVKFLLSHGADVNNVDYKMDSPVQIACDRLCRGNIYAILSSSLDFYKRVKKIPTPALQSLLLGERECSQCQFRIVRELINAGADVRQIRVKQLVASQYNLQRFLPILRFLVLCGVKVESGDEDLVPLSSQQFAAFRPWLREQVTKQMSLQRICRDSVRRHLGTHCRDNEKSVELLPLPHKMKQFLNVADFWQTEASETECDEGLCCMFMYH
ncbi:hypothetical protein BaRGS_00014083 [Batillaria attramentaria]|uniref:SOCS box domain-containing protein n=1 Tax=Batillaria attramentaria TaxID=370345 RepID=A0ABD0L5N8_9CAEN